MKQLSHVPITVKVLYEEEAKDAPYVAYIPEFDISSCGKTEAKAIHNAKEVLEITLAKVKSEGRLDEFLEESGYPYTSSSAPVYPKIIIEQFPFSFA